MPPVAADPLIKFPGRKDWLVPRLRELVGDRLQHGGRLFDLFCGSGAVSLGLETPNGGVMVDLALPLINLHRSIRLQPERVLRKLRAIASQGWTQGKHSEEYYYEVRSQQIEHGTDGAARLLYLNRVCYNGLFRIGPTGLSNVPYGDYKHPTWPTDKQIHAASKSLQSMLPIHGEYQSATFQVKAGDVVYADPPYYGVYDGYVGDGFNELEQRKLQRVLRRCVDQGAVAVTSNQDCPQIREIYEGWDIESIERTRSISQDASTRGKVTEVLMNLGF